MERGALEKLQYDKRLRLRNGWISTEDADRYLDDLPDVSDKIYVEEDEPDEQVEAVAEPAGAPGDPLAPPAEIADEGPADPLSPPPFREV